MDEPILENFSEKPKRGRPPLIGFDGIRRGQIAEDKTHRTQQNWLYLITAMGALSELPDAETHWRWFAPKGWELANIKFRHRTVLAELGRLRDPR